MTEPDPRWEAIPDKLPWPLYQDRARRVYWDKTFPACRAHGPSRAECLLNPNHEGEHFGNGYDAWGPKGFTSWRQRVGTEMGTSRSSDPPAPDSDPSP